MAKKYKIKKKHFRYFKRECGYWLDRFNLNSWQVYYVHEADNKDQFDAWFRADSWKNRACSIGLNMVLNVPVTKKYMSQVAFHEVCELLLYRIIVMGRIDAAPTQNDEIDEHSHATLRRMEHAIWRSYWEEKYGNCRKRKK